MISLKNVTLPYGVKNITAELPQGKLIGIMGANGAGKSSLLKAMAGIVPITSGEICIKNCKIAEISKQAISKQLAYLAQNINVHWDLSVYDVIALGLPFALKPKQEQQKVAQVAQQFNVSEFLNQPFKHLSGGEQARVHLARCCIKETPIILADEPIASLDPYYQIEIMTQLKALTPKQTCVVVIHHLDLAYRFCDEILLLNQGELLSYGKTQSVLTEQNLKTAFRVSARVDENGIRVEL